MERPFLSIIIVTYNRAFYIKQCLESLLQSEPYIRCGEVEVVVLDNGSTDSTSNILKQASSIIPIKSLQIENNIKFTKGFLTALKNANGEYCWILGDDDYLLEDISDLIKFLKEHNPDILILNHSLYMDTPGKSRIYKHNLGILRVFDSKIFCSYHDYFDSAVHINAFLTHVSPVIFKRNEWNRYFVEEEIIKFMPSESIHTYIFLKILKHSNKSAYFNKRMVALRFGASSDDWQDEHGRFSRFTIDIYFIKMFDAVFNNEKRLQRKIRKIILRDSILVLLLGTKIKHNFSLGFHINLFKLLWRYFKGYFFFWIVIIPVFLTKREVFVLLFKIYNKIQG